jgi:hypothetical protein
VLGFKWKMACFLVLLADDLVNVAAEVANGIAFDAFLAILADIGDDCGVTPVWIKTDVNAEKDMGAHP